MDRITLFGIRAYGRHGANPGERERVQPFDLTVVIEMDLQTAAASDELADTVDYASLHDRVRTVVMQTSFALLERLANDVLTAACEDARVTRAEVTIAKPGALAGATPAVTMSRTQR